jgi:hypothetical protein
MISKYSGRLIRTHILPKVLFMNSSSKGNDKDGMKPQNVNKPEEDQNHTRNSLFI